MPAPDRNSIITSCRALYPGDLYGPKYSMFQRVTPTGENLWDDFLVLGDGENFSHGTQDWLAAYIDDESICYILGRHQYLDRSAYAFKLNISDGTFAGDTAVHEQDPTPLLPTSDAMITSTYPNPFNSTTSLEISVRQPGEYELVVVNLLGQVIERRTLDLQPGVRTHEVSLADGQTSGIYFVQLRHGATILDAHKLLLLR